MRQLVALGIIERLVEALEERIILDGLEEADEVLMSFVIRGAVIPARFVHKAHKI